MAENKRQNLKIVNNGQDSLSQSAEKQIFDNKLDENNIQEQIDSIKKDEDLKQSQLN